MRKIQFLFIFLICFNVDYFHVLCDAMKSSANQYWKSSDQCVTRSRTCTWPPDNCNYAQNNHEFVTHQLSSCMRRPNHFPDNKFFITAGDQGRRHHWDSWKPSAIFVLSQKVFCCENSAVMRRNCMAAGLNSFDAKLSTNIFTFVFCVYLWRVQCVMALNDAQGEVILHSP